MRVCVCLCVCVCVCVCSVPTWWKCVSLQHRWVWPARVLQRLFVSLSERRLHPGETLTWTVTRCLPAGRRSCHRGAMKQQRCELRVVFKLCVCLCVCVCVCVSERAALQEPAGVLLQREVSAPRRTVPGHIWIEYVFLFATSERWISACLTVTLNLILTKFFCLNRNNFDFL